MDQKGPTFDKYELYYRQIVSPIATDGVDGVLFQFDDFRGRQGFRIPREGVYNVTVAAEGGGLHVQYTLWTQGSNELSNPPDTRL